MKKGKLFAPFLMLLAGAVASILMFYFHYSTKQTLYVLLAVLVIFYLAGCFIQKRVGTFVDQIREAEAKEGEVIEKEALTQDGESAVDSTGEEMAGENA
ncbi:hypothetical protein IMSAGC019_02003 [Lachnospiraceae bacterium]|nr:hypothetical protein IMSAGC019_02003 [Lachnospiraceae bacterium]